MNPDTDKNKSYYQRMYHQIHASEEFKERLIHMKTNTEQSTNTPGLSAGRTKRQQKQRFTWKTAAAAVILTIAVPASALAASHYFDLAGFFSRSGHTLPEDANKLIETDIRQTTASDTSKELPVNFLVKEALCDSGEINIVIEAKAVETGKYLLVPDWNLEPDTDHVKDILEIQEDKTIAEYARKKGLELMYIDSGFHPDSSFMPSSSSCTCKSLQDDTLAMFISADRTSTDTNLDAIMTYTMQSESDRKAGREAIKASSSFTLQDKSTLQTTVYRADGSSKIPETNAVLTSISMSQTEIRTYVDIYYENPTADQDEDGLDFRIKDSNTGQEWNFAGGRGIEQTADGTFHARLVYDWITLPKQCILEAYGTFEENVHGQITLKQAE